MHYIYSIVDTKYGNINNTMTLLKQINKPNLFPYEQMYIVVISQ